MAFVLVLPLLQSWLGEYQPLSWGVQGLEPRSAGADVLQYGQPAASLDLRSTSIHCSSQLLLISGERVGVPKLFPSVRSQTLFTHVSLQVVNLFGQTNITFQSGALL